MFNEAFSAILAGQQLTDNLRDRLINSSNIIKVPLPLPHYEAFSSFLRSSHIEPLFERFSKIKNTDDVAAPSAPIDLSTQCPERMDRIQLLFGVYLGSLALSSTELPLRWLCCSSTSICHADLVASNCTRFHGSISSEVLITALLILPTSHSARKFLLDRYRSLYTMWDVLITKQSPPPHRQPVKSSLAAVNSIKKDVTRAQELQQHHHDARSLAHSQARTASPPPPPSSQTSSSSSLFNVNPSSVAVDELRKEIADLKASLNNKPPEPLPDFTSLFDNMRTQLLSQLSQSQPAHPPPPLYPNLAQPSVVASQPVVLPPPQPPVVIPSHEQPQQQQQQQDNVQCSYILASGARCKRKSALSSRFSSHPNCSSHLS